MHIDHRLLAVNGIELMPVQRRARARQTGVAAAWLSRMLVRLASADRDAGRRRLPGVRPGNAWLRRQQRAG